MSDKKKSDAAEEKPRFRVECENAGYRGVRFGVAFNDGVGLTSDVEIAGDLAAAGFRVIDSRPSPKK